MAKADVIRVIEERKRAYQLLFGGVDVPHRITVFADLSRFCREKTSTFNPDPRVHALLEGRREVMLRIRDFLDLSIEQLVTKYGGLD